MGGCIGLRCFLKAFWSLRDVLGVSQPGLGRRKWGTFDPFESTLHTSAVASPSLVVILVNLTVKGLGLRLGLGGFRVSGLRLRALSNSLLGLGVDLEFRA